ncbi:MAG: hypothetical protein U1D41_05935 [Nitrosomonas sp.]|uniref:hypothetical protein n=1 Tax=Nitrosomonas sp. TaxID=42353 RepID=UPI002ABBE581|nr:hypothetical protein [Nitrosomonas sp.]MDZ4105692.1 hypothetical protein [Nitrosomonas sp.]
MPRKLNAESAVLDALEPYLRKKHDAFMSTSESEWKPTLPCKQEGSGFSVNARQIAKDIETDLFPRKWETIENYLKNRHSLKAAINLIAQAQGLQQIGERGINLPGASGRNVTQVELRLIKARRDASSSRQSAANNALLIQGLQAEIATLEEKLRKVESENRRLHAELDAIRSGHFFNLEG